MEGHVTRDDDAVLNRDSGAVTGGQMAAGLCRGQVPPCPTAGPHCEATAEWRTMPILYEGRQHTLGDEVGPVSGRAVLYQR